MSPKNGESDEARRSPVAGLQGMRDFLPGDEVDARTVVSDALAFLAGRGFERVDTPLLEDSELFVRKGGGELTGLLYSFTDPGGNRVSLRPEFTSSVIRMFIDGREGLELPVRWSYGGPVFRYDRDRDGRCRQFTQVGAEIIGASGIKVDAELVAAAVEGLAELGVEGVSARVGHIETLRRIFSGFALSESARRFVTGNLGRLKRGETDARRLSDRARESGLVGTLGTEVNDGLEPARLRPILDAMVGQGRRGPLGRRTPDQIMDRLLRKSRRPNDPAELDRALDIASRLVELVGSPGSTIGQAKALAREAGADEGALDPLEGFLDALSGAGVGTDKITVDMGLARGIAYYTGAVFELTGPGALGSSAGSFASSFGGSFGGGGRYDGLVSSLGGPDLPALGFAYDMEAVVAGG